MIKKQHPSIGLDKKLFKNTRVAIIRTDYHIELTTSLEDACRKTLITNGVAAKNIQTIIAPGAWEIPLLTKVAAQSGKFDAIVTFGVIVRGETHHFDLIANECTRALMQLSLDYSLPVAFEILAVYEKKHAVTRASDNDTNKGIEGALAVLKTISAMKTI